MNELTKSLVDFILKYSDTYIKIEPNFMRGTCLTVHVSAKHMDDEITFDWFPGEGSNVEDIMEYVINKAMKEE